MKTLLILAFIGLATVTGPAMAIIDDGSGCGCIRPCYPIKHYS